MALKGLNVTGEQIQFIYTNVIRPWIFQNIFFACVLNYIRCITQ